MKKYFLTIMCMAVFAMSLSAQKLPKSVKDAKKALNAGSAAEAIQLINTALEDETTAGISEAWAVKGDALASLVAVDVTEIVKARMGGAENSYKVQNISYGLDAFTAYETALAKSTGDKDKGLKASVKGLVGLATNLNEIGLHLFNNKRYEDSYNAFNTVINSRNALLGIGNKSILTKEEDYQTIQYYTGLAANAAGTPEKASAIYKDLVDANYNMPLPYEQMFTSLIDTDEKAAFEILEKGKKACSEDPKNLVGFLYKEINFYLKKQEYDVLETKLQDAIAQDPDNPTLYYALGNVYGSLSQEAYKENDSANGDKHLEDSEKYYTKTMEIDPKHFDSAYNIGALYFNKAAILTETLNNFNDNSSAGNKKYNELKTKRNGLLNEAIPFFEKALSINPKHIQSIDALKGIAAFNNDTAGMQKYSKMLEDAQK